MTDKMDWIDEGKCDAPPSHDETFRTMTEMRESIRDLVNRAQLQNDKLRSPEILSEIEGEEEAPPDSDV